MSHIPLIQGGLTVKSRHRGASDLASIAHTPAQHWLDPLEPRTHLNADLVGTILANKLPGTLVPGDKGAVVLTLTNQGDSAAVGKIRIALVASTDHLPDELDAPLQTWFQSINLKPGQSKAFSAKVVVPGQQLPGTYFLLAGLDTTGVLSEDDRSNNIAQAPAPLNIEWNFGSFAGRKNIKLTLPDTDGSLVTFAMSGSGLGSVDRENDQFHVTIGGTTTASATSITVKGGDGRANLGSVHSTSPLKSISAKTTDVVGAGILVDSSIASLDIGDVQNAANIYAGAINSTPAKITARSIDDGATIIFRSAIASLTAARIGSAQISAPSLGAVTVKGDCGVVLVATQDGLSAGTVTLAKLTVAGVLRAAEINVTGSIGAITTVRMVDSLISASGRLNSVNVKGVSGSSEKAYVRTAIIANDVGKVHLASVETDYAYDSRLFGIIGYHAIGSVKVDSQGLFFSRDPGDFGVQSWYNYRTIVGETLNSDNWFHAGVTNSLGQVTLRALGRDLPLRFIDQTTGQPISGLSATISMGTGENGVGTLVVSGVQQQYGTRVITLVGPSAANLSGASDRLSGQSEPEQPAFADFAINALGDQAEAMEIIEHHLLPTHEVSRVAVLTYIEAIKASVRLLNWAGLPIESSLRGSAFATTRRIESAEAMERLGHLADHQIKHAAIFTGVGLALGGSLSVGLAAGVMLNAHADLADLVTIANCDGDLYLTHFLDMDYYTCRPHESLGRVEFPPNPNIRLELAGPDPNNLHNGFYELLSLSKLGEGFVGALDSHGNAPIPVTVPAGDYLLRMGGQGVTPSESRRSIVPGNQTIHQTTTAAAQVARVSLIFDGVFPSNLAPGSTVQFHARAWDAQGRQVPCDNPEFKVHNPAVASVAAIDAHTGLLTVGPDWGGAYVTVTCDGITSSPVVMSGAGGGTSGGIPGITVTPTSGPVTGEDGASTTFQVVLDSAPTANVAIPVSSSNSHEGVTSVSTITFTRGNWNVPQTVRVTGVDDSVVDGDIAYTVLTGPAVSADPNYNSLDAANVGVTNRDNDSAASMFHVVSSSLQVIDRDPYSHRANVLVTVQGNVTGLTRTVLVVGLSYSASDNLLAKGNDEHLAAAWSADQIPPSYSYVRRQQGEPETTSWTYTCTALVVAGTSYVIVDLNDYHGGVQHLEVPIVFGG